MNRKAWAAVMAVSFLASGASAYYVYTHFKTNKLPTVPSPVAAPAPVVPPTEVKPAEPEPKPEIQLPATRNILFRFPKPKAKSVFIIGDFNDWKRQPLEKKGKNWEITFALKPGTYEYMFVVDDKRIKDPNNKTIHDGKSVITVKPLQ